MLKRTSLYDRHVALNAKLAEFGGFDMPIQYTSVKDEVLAVRKTVGVFDVSHMGEFWVSGPEALKFVDYLVTNDVASAPIGKAVYSPLCRPDGTIVDDLIVYKLENERILICVNASNIAKDWDWISSQVKSFNCSLIDKSEETSLLAVQGPLAEEVLRKIGLDSNLLKEMSYYEVRSSVYRNEKIVLARTGYTGEDGFEVFAPHTIIAFLWDKLAQEKAVPCGLAARDVLRTEVCYPLYGHEINDHNTPLDAGLKWTVRSQKEKFIGKEALSKHTARTKLIKFTCKSGIPRQGHVIVNAQHETLGTVTSGTHSVTLGMGIGLALVDAKKYIADRPCHIIIRDKEHDIAIQDKPFVKGGHK
ncbi:MAG: hypothetical protein A2X86_04565 [Bdellovibrionales bacterium GWA2_49_15]|nr:MAG: hypothetical protein A2X86_04565 [Bdellovibrionales bacterium GWA2_49_15]